MWFYPALCSMIFLYLILGKNKESRKILFFISIITYSVGTFLHSYNNLAVDIYPLRVVFNSGVYDLIRLYLFIGFYLISFMLYPFIICIMLLALESKSDISEFGHKALSQLSVLVNMMHPLIVFLLRIFRETKMLI